MLETNPEPLIERPGTMRSRNLMFSALRYPNFRWFWLSTALWAMGRWMEMVALGWLVLELTNSPLILGVVMACRGIPMLLLGAFGGIIADRLNRRIILIVAQTSLGLLALLMALLITTGGIHIWHVTIITLLAGAVTALSMPARQALLFDIVGRSNLLNATAMNRIAMDATRIIGPALGGGAIILGGTSGSFYLMGISYIASVVVILMMGQRSSSPVGGRSSAWQNFKVGLKYIQSNHTVLLLLSMEIVIDTFAFSYYSMLPVFAHDILGVGAAGLGFLMSASGVGALFGLLVVATLGDFKYKGPLLLGTCFSFGVMLIFFAASTSYPISIALLIGAGAASAVYDTVMATLLQTIVPDEMRGRVLGTYVLTWGMAPLGGIPAGAVANFLGANFAIAIGGAIVGIYALIIASRASSVRRLS